MSITKLASFFFSQIRAPEEERNRIYEPVSGVVTDNKDRRGRTLPPEPWSASWHVVLWARLAALADSPYGRAAASP